MKDPRQERLGRLQREYHRSHQWRLGPGGLFVPHSYAEVKPDALSWWDDVGFILNGRRVIVWWRHPRYVYHDALEEQASEQAGEFPFDDWLMKGAIPSYRKVGRSISRNTLREVFRLLTKEGLLRHEPNRGVSVAVPSIASIIDIYRVRRLIECQAMAQAYPRNPAIQHMRRAVEAGQTCRDNADWQGVGTANMEFHMAIVELADSERLNTMFAHLLAELRLAFGLLNDPEFLHAPYVEMNVKILELFEAGKLAEAAAALNDYLVHSERIVLAVYARRISDGGQPK